MAIEITIRHNHTLLRLVQVYHHDFYPQNWFFDEEFANTPAKQGIWRLDPDCETGQLVPAVILAFAHVCYPSLFEVHLYDYVWTSDTDNQLNRIYVGGLRHGKGFQVHRHLANPDVKTALWKV